MNPHTYRRSDLRLFMEKYLLQNTCERVAQGNAEIIVPMRGINLR